MLSGNLKFSEIKTFFKLETYLLCLLWNVENLLNLSIMVGNFFILLSFSGHILVQSRRWYIILKYYIMSDYTLNWVGGSETRGTDFSKKTRGYQFFIFIKESQNISHFFSLKGENLPTPSFNIGTYVSEIGILSWQT